MNSAKIENVNPVSPAVVGNLTETISKVGTVQACLECLATCAGQNNPHMIYHVCDTLKLLARECGDILTAIDNAINAL